MNLSVCLYICLSIHLSVYLSIYPCDYLPIYLSVASIGQEWPWICALKSLQGTGMGKGDMEDKLLPMQQVPPLHVPEVPPLHVPDVTQVKGKSPYSLAPVLSQELPERC